MKTIRIATRASKLALTQSNYIASRLKELSDDIEVQIVEVSTKGDRDKSVFLYKVGTMGFFTSEVENALLDDRADLAVHSLKDLPTAIRQGLVIAAIPTRENVADALVTNTKAESVEDLPAGATVGTSSLRRIAQIKHIRPDLDCQPLRGNVETRVDKVESARIDAIIIAAAGLNRLNLSNKISAVLPPDKFLPAPAQGALAVQIRQDDAQLACIVKKLEDKDARITAQTERHILAAMHGGCSIPLGVYARIDAQKIIIDAAICDVQGHGYIKRSASGKIESAMDYADQIAQELLNAGGREILDNIRDQRDEQN